MATRHILLVDDEPRILFSLAVLLRQEGYRVSTAEDAFQALERLFGENAELSSVDLIMTDLLMPGIDGLELIKRIRAQKACLPIVVLSAQDSAETGRQAMELGCQDYLEKPLEPQMLLETIERLLPPASHRSSGQAGTYQADGRCLRLG
jgi:DNA-binding response OmpR family regulator